MQDQGFEVSSADPSIYDRFSTQEYTVIAVYVDDIIAISNNMVNINEFTVLELKSTGSEARRSSRSHSWGTSTRLLKHSASKIASQHTHQQIAILNCASVIQMIPDQLKASTEH